MFSALEQVFTQPGHKMVLPVARVAASVNVCSVDRSELEGSVCLPLGFRVGRLVANFAGRKIGSRVEGGSILNEKRRKGGCEVPGTIGDRSGQARPSDA